MAEDTNNWKATRYLKPDNGSRWSRIPPLQKADRSMTTNNSEQAEQLLTTFFPALPETIKDEGDRPQRQPVPMPELIVEEIECCLMKLQAKTVWRPVCGDKYSRPRVKASVTYSKRPSIQERCLSSGRSQRSFH
jgi:hypothetical protein